MYVHNVHAYIFLVYSFPSDPYPEGFRASHDFLPEMFSTYHGHEALPRASSPPPWFVKEGDMVVPSLHAVSDQVHCVNVHLYMRFECVDPIPPHDVTVHV